MTKMLIDHERIYSMHNYLGIFHMEDMWIYKHVSDHTSGLRLVMLPRALSCLTHFNPCNIFNPLCVRLDSFINEKVVL